jgi:hypothetical protein
MKKEKQRGYKVERQSWVLGVVPCCWRRHIWGVPGVVVDSSILYSTLFSSLHVFCTFPPFLQHSLFAAPVSALRTLPVLSLAVFKVNASYCLYSLYCKCLQNLYTSARNFVFWRSRSRRNRQEFCASGNEKSRIHFFGGLFGVECLNTMQLGLK